MAGMEFLALGTSQEAREYQISEIADIVSHNPEHRPYESLALSSMIPGPC